MMQIYDQKFFKKYPLKIFNPGLCGHAGGLGLAVEPEKWKKIEFENERGYRNRIWKRASLAHFRCSIAEFALFPI